MKLPVILRTNHDLVVGGFEEEINLRNEELKGKENVIRNLKNKNHKLNTRVIASIANVEKLEDTNHELHQDILSSEKTIKELMDRIKSLEFCNKEANKEIKKLNNRIEINIEAKKQIRDICVCKNDKGKTLIHNSQVLVNENVNGLKIYELSMLIG
jgi:chromosome segregation ATPase